MRPITPGTDGSQFDSLSGPGEVEERRSVHRVHEAQRLSGHVDRRAAIQARQTLAEAALLRVLRMLPSHRSLEAIGAELFISRNTVKSHTMAIYRKLGVSGRSAAVARATSLGLVEPG